MRLVYNAVLALATLALGWRFLGDPAFWIYLVACMFAANVCFCVGPCVEGYAVLIGISRKPVRGILLFLGLALGLFLTVLAVLSYGFRGF
jgi:hypothetical protein